MNIGEPEVTANLVKGRSRVVHAEQVQHGRVQVVNVDFAFDHAVAQVIGLAVREVAFHAAASHPGTEALGQMFATVLVDRSRANQVLAPRSTAELAAPQHERVVEQPALLQVLEQPHDGLIGLLAEPRQVAANVTMMVPAVHRDLHEPDARRAQLSPQQTRTTALVALHTTADAVEIECRGRIFREIDQSRRRGLHTVREFHAVDHPFHVRITMQFVDQPLVKSLCQIEPLPLNGFRSRNVLQILDRQHLVMERHHQRRAWMLRREKTGRVSPHSMSMNANECRQVFDFLSPARNGTKVPSMSVLP